MNEFGPLAVNEIVFNFGVTCPEGLLCDDFLRNKGFSVAVLDAIMLRPVSMHAQMASSTLSYRKSFVLAKSATYGIRIRVAIDALGVVSRGTVKW